MSAGATALVLLQASMASAAPACAAPLAPLPAEIRTTGEVTTRAGRTVAFEADAGLLRVQGGGLKPEKSVWTVPVNPKAKPATATLSYYAYFAKDPAASARPLVFVWDGGPGASTRPMLMNSFGPIRLNEPARLQNAATRDPVRPNPDTLLDVADVVFVDAPGTGFGRLEGCRPQRDFYGIDVDAAVFQRFITQFVHAHHRERSPLVLIGESYGTVRAAEVARRLEAAGTPVSAVVLISQLMAFDAWSDGSKANVGAENAAFLTLPTYAATAWSHGKTPRQGDLESRLREVERFSLDVYAPALLQGANLPAGRRQALAETLASYTGVPARTWLDNDLRIEGSRFRDLLEGGEGKIVGREDTRLDGPAPKVRGSAVEDDPTGKDDGHLFRDAFNRYVRGTLKLGDRTFTPFIDGPDTRWNMHHLTDPAAWPDTYVNVAPDLVAAMRADADMRVLVVGGYYDLAAPYFGGQYLVSHLPLTPSERGRIAWKAYPGPHSVYAVDEVRTDLHDRIAGLISRR